MRQRGYTACYLLPAISAIPYSMHSSDGKIANAWRGSVVWPNARAWKARIPKGIKGSNPFLSATISPG